MVLSVLSRKKICMLNCVFPTIGNIEVVDDLCFSQRLCFNSNVGNHDGLAEKGKKHEKLEKTR